MAFAHPHVFANAVVKVLFNDKGLTAVHNHWVYDEIYSAAMFASGDQNKNGKIDPDENELIKNSVLSPIAKSNYYNYVLKDTEFLGVEKISNFKASMDKGRLILDFDAVFTCPVKDDYTMIVVVVADPTGYIQINADMESSDVEAPEKVDVEFFNDALDGLTLFRAFSSSTEGLYLRFKKIP